MQRIFPKVSISLILFQLVVVFLLLWPTKEVQAVEFFPNVDIATSYPIIDKEAIDGDILIYDKNGLIRAPVSYDPRIFGVLTMNPLVYFKVADSTNTPVSRNGVVSVNVTTFNGTIVKGDIITSSEIVGKGMKGTTSGYVLGTALESFDGSNGENISFGGASYKSGKVAVAIRVEYAEISAPQSFKRVFDAIGAAFFSNVRDPNRFGQVVRYIAAGLIVLSSIIFAFVTFSRAIPKGIEAIGRNPLARTSILASIIIAIVFMVVIIAVGVIAAVIVLRI